MPAILNAVVLAVMLLTLTLLKIATRALSHQQVGRRPAQTSPAADAPC